MPLLEQRRCHCHGKPSWTLSKLPFLLSLNQSITPQIHWLMSSPQRLRFKTIILSDVHLGLPDCRIAEVNTFLRHTESEKLILNGDIIDAWHLRRWGKWKKDYTHFFRIILKKIEKNGTEVVYIRGNHDDFLWRVMPLQFEGLHVCNEHIHETPHGKYVCVHGDGFDAVTTNHQWIAMLGGIGYSALLRANRLYNNYRRLRGKPFFSLSKLIKSRVKSAVSYVGKYEDQLQQFAARKNCEGIICGHIHTPADKRVGEVHYLNSGDWVESSTAVVETLDRQMKLVDYESFEKALGLTESVSVAEEERIEAGLVGSDVSVPA